jgi:hypothetical protein
MTAVRQELSIGDRAALVRRGPWRSDLAFSLFCYSGKRVTQWSRQALPLAAPIAPPATAPTSGSMR